VKNPSATDEPDGPSPIGLAFEWVGRILAVTIEMVVPGLLGQQLDKYLGTRFLVLVGFGGGISLALYHLIVMTRAHPPSIKKRPPGDGSSGGNSGGGQAGSGGNDR
jgi:hypothetical protein